jgi:hypothetical protein
MKKSAYDLISPEAIAPMVHWLRHEKIILDSDLAELYGVEARVLNQAVKRNIGRFPADFMFQLTAEEWDNLRAQMVNSKNEHHSAARGNSSQTVMSSKKHRGHKYLPYAFTEQGVAMLSSVLRSQRAVEVNIAIMRTFVQLRRLMDSNRELARKIGDMEKKYDGQFRMVFDAIRQLISQPSQPTRELGFHTIAHKKVSKKAVKKASRPKS